MEASKDYRRTSRYDIEIDGGQGDRRIGSSCLARPAEQPPLLGPAVIMDK
jgi:hypothetical protein